MFTTTPPDDAVSHHAIEAALLCLGNHPDYRVLKRLPMLATKEADNDQRWQSENTMGTGSCQHPIRILIVDTETTGLSADDDRIIEIGMVLAEFSGETGEFHRVLAVYNGFEDPGFPIPPASTAIHGITDEMVCGTTFDDALVHALIEQASLTLAHNAKFDRVFLEKRFPSWEAKPWGCTYQQIPWAEEGVSSAKLEFILMQYGYFYDAHRAITDCEAVLQVLRTPLLRSGLMPVLLLTECAHQRSFEIIALGAAYEFRSALKAHGFYWDVVEKAWVKTVHSKLAGDETIAWLKENIYQRVEFVDLGFRVITAMERFSLRQRRNTIKRV